MRNSHITENTPEKIVTEQLTIRVKPIDKEFTNTFLNGYTTKQEGYSALMHLAQRKNEIKEVEVHQNLENIFEFDSYKNFGNTSDTIIFEPIKRALDFANQQFILIENNQAPLQPSIKPIDFIDKTLIDKVKLLHRDLKMKGKTPTDATDQEYLEQLLMYALRYFLLNEYPKIYNRP